MIYLMIIVFWSSTISIVYDYICLKNVLSWMCYMIKCNANSNNRIKAMRPHFNASFSTIHLKYALSYCLMYFCSIYSQVKYIKYNHCFYVENVLIFLRNYNYICNYNNVSCIGLVSDINMIYYIFVIVIVTYCCDMHVINTTVVYTMY